MLLYALLSLSLLFPFHNPPDLGLRLFASQNLIPVLTKRPCKQRIPRKQHLQPGRSGSQTF